MGIFSRRVLYRILVENSKFLHDKALSEHIRRLNGRDEIQRVTTEWEATVLNGLSKLGTVDYEPAQISGTSKPDALFTNSLGTALMDITTVSDRGLDQQNPIRKLSNRLNELVRENGIDPDRFGLQVAGNFRELHIGGPKPRLFIPRQREFDTAIFSKDFHEFLNEVRRWPGVKRSYSPKNSSAQVTITYDPKQMFSSMSYLGYTVLFTPDQNTIYSALEDKSTQLKSAQFSGIKGIVLCDGGCDAMLRHGTGGMSVTVKDIILSFLSKHRSIDFVLTLIVKSDSNGLSGPERLRFVAEGYVWSPKSGAIPLVAELKNGLPNVFPSPENTLLNAYGLENEGKSLNGGGIMDGTSIKMSSRSLVNLLSGKITQEDFLRDNPHVMETLARAVKQGRMLKDAKIELRPDKDDDWIEFSFSDPDPAISPFPRIRRQ